MNLSIKEIESILFEIGFIKKSSNDEPGYYYEFYQEYSGNQPDGSNLWVSFEEYKKEFIVRWNCHNFMHEEDITKILTKEMFLDNLDYVVICSRKSWIYEDRGYSHWWEVSDKQRERYFDNRMKMDYSPKQDIFDSIKEFGTKHFKTYLETEYNGVRLVDMSWNQLAGIIHNIINGVE
jgi:hypothetical protein